MSLLPSSGRQRTEDRRTESLTNLLKLTQLRRGRAGTQACRISFQGRLIPKVKQDENGPVSMRGPKRGGLRWGEGSELG